MLIAKRLLGAMLFQIFRFHSKGLHKYYRFWITLGMTFVHDVIQLVYIREEHHNSNKWNGVFMKVYERTMPYEMLYCDVAKKNNVNHVPKVGNVKYNILLMRDGKLK